MKLYELPVRTSPYPSLPSSHVLVPFLRDWHGWATSPVLTERYCRSEGLCPSLSRWCKRHCHDRVSELQFALKSLLGHDTGEPDFPFENSHEYFRYQEHYRNPHRLKWVQDKLGLVTISVRGRRMTVNYQPIPDLSTWTAFDGNTCPVDPSTKVQVIYKYEITNNQHESDTQEAGSYEWDRNSDDTWDIKYYKVVTL